MFTLPENAKGSEEAKAAFLRLAEAGSHERFSETLFQGFLKAWAAVQSAPAEQEQKTASLILRQTRNYDLFESCFGMPIVTFHSTTVITGSGESADWKQMAFIRVNGKQVWRGYPGDIASMKFLFGGELVLCGKIKPGVSAYFWKRNT